MTDLETVSTDDLIDELVKRSEAIIFAMLPLANEGKSKVTQWGNMFTCLGFAYTMLKQAKIRVDEAVEPE